MIHRQTVSPLLLDILTRMMSDTKFDEFRLVGGTALSLQYGHRISTDIDLFSTTDYNKFDLKPCVEILQSWYSVVQFTSDINDTIGTSLFIGNDPNNLVKVDLWHEEPFIYQPVVHDIIRMASPMEIGAMKLNVLASSPRKKDYHDLHLLSKQFSFAELLDAYQLRYPYSYDLSRVKSAIENPSQSDDDFDPISLIKTPWELMKYDLLHWGRIT